MNTYFFTRASMFKKLLTNTVLFLLLAACGTHTDSPVNRPSSNVHSTPTANRTVETSSTPAPISSTSPPEAFFRDPSIFDPAPMNPFTLPQNLSIYGEWAGCGMNNDPTNIVLATNRQTYDSGEIQQIENYFNEEAPGSPAPVLPPTLQYALGFFPGSITKWGLSNSPAPCALQISVTNTGSTTVQIDNVLLKMAQDALPNKYYYHLIDVCSLTFTNKMFFCPIGRGAEGAPYTYNYQLGAEKAHTSVKSTSSSPGLITHQDGTFIRGRNEVITLNPGDTADIIQKFEEKNSASNYIYSIMPQISLGPPDAQQTVDLNQLTGHVAFLNPKTQSMCYQLVGQNFVPIDHQATPQVSTSSTLPINTQVNCI